MKTSLHPSYCAATIAALVIALSSASAQAQSGLGIMEKLKAKVEQDLKDKVPAKDNKDNKDNKDKAPASGSVLENIPGVGGKAAASKSPVLDSGDSDKAVTITPAYKSYTGSIPPPATRTRFRDKVGQILFSKKPIDYGKEEKSEITNQFEASDEIHAMAYTLGTLKELKFGKQLTFFVYDRERAGSRDGDRGFSHTYTLEDTQFLVEKRNDGSDPATERYFDFDVAAPYAKDAFRPYIPYAFLIDLKKYLNNKSVDDSDKFRTHVLEIILQANRVPVAAGVIHYTIKPENAPKAIAMHDTHFNAELETFKLPPSKRNDPALAEKIKAAMIARGAKVHAIIFSSSDWDIVRHERTGTILRRAIPAYVVSRAEGKLCRFQEVMFTSEYVGGSFSSKVDVGGASIDGGSILCSNVK
jgi:hypothetical protein